MFLVLRFLYFMMMMFSFFMVGWQFNDSRIFFSLFCVCLNNLLDYIVFNNLYIRELNNQKNEEENMFMNKKIFFEIKIYIILKNILS